MPRLLSNAPTVKPPTHTSEVKLQVVAAIPACDEEKTIGSVVITARRYADKVVVVDDGSQDDTAWVAEQAGAIVIQHPRNLGYGAALRSCFSYARSNGCGVLVILDADGQHRPQAIPRVIAPVAEGRADVSIGSRFVGSGSAKAVPRYRKLGIGLITRLTNLGTHQNGRLRDAQSGFRAYSRIAVDAIDPLETDMGASTEIIWEADRKGLRIVEVPIDVDYGAGGAARGPIRHGVSVIGSMLRYVETKHSLLAFGVPGLLLALAGFGLGLFVVQSYYDTRVLAVGLALLTSMLVFVGTLLLFSGLILHAVINANRRMR